MFGKTLIAASAVVSLLSATAAFAEPAAKLSATSVAKIQDLSRARAHLDTRKRSHAANVAAIGGALVVGGLGGAAIESTTHNNP